MPKESDLAKELQQIREAKTRQFSQGTKGASEAAMSVKSLIASVVTEFVEADEALTIQSAPAASYFIALGLAFVCRVEVATTNTNGSVSITGDPNFAQFYSFDPDAIDKAALRRQVKDGLLAWYKSCFS
ncbi:hypothetical protein [Alicyclobacillus sp. ALC3]|uniref:hypothetical protein n=1 Tax=Alicyclobacillus sp. ALC3 TaxID=2796143 RepID=UPI002378310E|nr:hypothetical protein [Alicyclobacillus sp. ALC3]WDL97526.1 hypothetical protein JC200_02005 [Alicyclobacillus sp. ALC3]